jgi:hypothetical protein
MAVSPFIAINSSLPPLMPPMGDIASSDPSKVAGKARVFAPVREGVKSTDFDSANPNAHTELQPSDPARVVGTTRAPQVFKSLDTEEIPSSSPVQVAGDQKAPRVFAETPAHPGFNSPVHPGFNDPDPDAMIGGIPSSDPSQLAPISQSRSPKVFTPMGAIEHHLDDRLAQDYNKDLHPWGTPENHPGFWGKLGHAINHGLGGDTRRGWEEKGLEARLEGVTGKDYENQERGANTGHLNEETKEMPDKATAEEGLQDAQTEEARARAKKIDNPDEVYKDVPGVMTADARPIALGEHSGKFQAGDISGIVPDKANATKMEHVAGQLNGKLKEGNFHPDTGKYTDPDTGAEMPGFQPEPQPVAAQGGTVFVVPPDPNKPGSQPTLHRIMPGQAVPEGSTTPGGTSSISVADTKKEEARKDALKESQDDYALMQNFAKNPSPTNDLAMVMHYIGATKPDSLGKLRLNQNEIKLVFGTRSSLGDLDALVNRVSNGQSLTATQRQDMLGTMRILSESKGEGVVQPDAPQYQHTATGKDGHKIGYDGTKWVDVQTGKAVQ